MDKYYVEGEQSSPGLIQKLRCDNILCEEKTPFQDIVIFTNPVFGVVLALDNVIQTTENDEFIYHEMMTHVPVLGHGSVERVLVIGGCDGGILRNVLRYPNVREAVMVEIDERVIELSKKHLPKLCRKAFEDSRAKVIIGDGFKYVAETQEKFDILFIDSTDPVGPGKCLFTPDFYRNCKRCLTPGGIVTAQSGVPFLLPETPRTLNASLRPVFADVAFYLCDIPSFVCGPAAFVWASDNTAMRQTDASVIEQRLKESGIDDLKYFTPELFKAAFALPKYIRDSIAMKPAS